MKRPRHFRFLLILLIAGAVGLIVSLQWDARVKAKLPDSAAIGMPERHVRHVRHVREFLAAESPSTVRESGDHIWSSEPLGESSWMVSRGLKGLRGGKPERFLVDCERTVHRVAAGPLSDILREEFHPHLTDPDHEKFIADFIKRLHDESFIRLQSVDDIPGYQNRPLLAERAAEIQPPHRTPEGNQVFFTYQQIGGYVRRYEIHYAKDGGFLRVEETESGQGIGNARYYR